MLEHDCSAQLCKLQTIRTLWIWKLSNLGIPDLNSNFHKLELKIRPDCDLLQMDRVYGFNLFKDDMFFVPAKQCF